MNVVWINRSFLHYRVDVYIALNKLLGGDFVLITSAHLIAEEIKNELNEAGVHVIYLDNERVLIEAGAFGKKSLFISYQPGLYKLIKGLNPAALIVEGFAKWSMVAIFFKLFMKIPVVVSYERTLHTERNNGFIKRGYHRFYANYIANTFCINGVETKRYLESLGVEVSVMHEGAMSARAGLDNCFIRDDCSIVRFLFVGQLIERKGVVHLLRAWKKVTSDSDDCELTIVGDGPDVELLQKYVCECNIKNITFSGAVPHSEISNYYLSHHVLVIPTLEDNWSLVVPEAMAYSMPIITTIYNGCSPELVTKNNGVVVDPLDYEELSSAMLFFVKNRERIRDFGCVSFDISRKFTPEDVAQCFKDALLGLDVT